MRYAIAAILLLFSTAAFSQLDQFRMVGTGSWTTQDDSTHYATVTFASDLTANSFLPTGIVDSMRVFTQRGQVYTIDSVGAKTFSTAVIYVVEYGGDWGKPSGQVVVYETRGRETVPAIPFASNGATSKLQEAVVTHNAAINNGISTATLADSAAAARTYTNNQVAAVAPVKDTIVQALHGFSLGDPLWYSGNYILARDTGTSVRVDGVVVEVIDANTFVRQRSGRFTLSSHGFTANIQLYVQNDGTYESTVGNNALVYGYAVNANEIEIGLKDDQISNIADKYKTQVIPGITSKDAAIDYIYNERYTSKFQQEITDISVSIDSVMAYDKYTLVLKNDTINKNLRVLLPYPSTNSKGKSFEIVDSSIISATTYIQPTYDQTPNMYVDGKLSTKYTLSLGEKVTVTQVDGSWHINSQRKGIRVVQSLTDATIQYDVGEVIELEGSNHKYKILTSPGDIETDNFTVYEVNEKTIGNPNLLYWSAELTDMNNPVGRKDWVIRGSIGTENYITEAPDGSMTGIRMTRINTSNNPLFTQLLSDSLNIGDTLTVSMWMRKPVNQPTSIWSMQARIGSESYGLLADTSDLTSEWQKFSTTLVSQANYAEGIASITFAPKNAGSIPVGDSTYVWGFQVERGVVASDYKETGPYKTYGDGTVYAVIDNLKRDGLMRFTEGTFYVDDYVIPGLDYREKIEYALNYCAADTLCGRVFFNKSFTLDTTLTMPLAELTLESSDGREITANLNNSNLDVIRVEDGFSPKSVIVRNVQINAVSPARAGFSIQYSRSSLIDNVRINGNDFLEYGFLSAKDTTSPSTLFLTFRRCIAANCKYNYRFITGNRYKMDQCYANAGYYGVYATGGGLIIEDGSFESTDSAAVYYDGRGDLVLKGIYSEALSVVDSTGPSYNVVGARKFSAYDVYHNTGTGMKSKAVFKLNDVKNASIRNLYTATTYPLWLTDSIGNWEIEYVAQANDNNNELFFRTDLIPESTLDRGKINGQRARSIVNLQNKQWIRYSHLDSSLLSNPIVSDTFFLHNAKIKGKTQNLIYPSEELSEGEFGNISVYSDSDVAPDGETTAEIIVADTTFSGDGFWFTLDADLKANTQFVLSFWAKTNNEDTDCYISTDQVGYVRSSAIKSTYYRRYFQQFQTTTAKSGLGLRVGNMEIGDTISIWGIQVNEGLYPFSYIKTTTEVVNDDIARWYVVDTLHYTAGVVRIDTLHLQAVMDSDGDLTTTGQFLKGEADGTVDWSSIAATDVSSSADSSNVQLELAGFDLRLDIIETELRYKGFTAISTDPSSTLSPRPGEVYYFDTTSAGWTQEFDSSNLQTGASFRAYFISTDVNSLTLDATSGGFIRPSSNGDTAADDTEVISTLGFVEIVWNGTDFVIFE